MSGLQRCTVEHVFLVYLAGVPVTRDAVLELAALLDKPDPELADRLREVVERGARVVALDDNERAAILKVLLDPPDGLEPVRGTLLREWPAARQPDV